jgi:uncharacterized protein
MTQKSDRTSAIHDRDGLIQAIREQYVLEWYGIHGWDHWMKVHKNGLLLASENGADLRVIELFALLHDSCRLNDGHDPVHGPRAAEFTKGLNGDFFTLEEPALAILTIAIRDHTSGYVHDDPTIAVCWDADRLELPRVGIPTDPDYLGTDAAKRMLKEKLKG